MTKTINNWKPVVKSFLTIAAKHGLQVTEVDDGGDEDETTFTSDINVAADAATATDESRVYFRTPEGKQVVAFLVLGNEPYETVCDCSVHPLMDKATEEFSEEWEGKKVPTKIITR